MAITAIASKRSGMAGAISETRHSFGGAKELVREVDDEMVEA